MGTHLWTSFGFLLAAFAATVEGVCNSPVGIGDSKQALQRITDAQMTASSNQPYAAPFYARPDEKRDLGAWCPKQSDMDQFLRIDLGQVHTLTRIETWGGSRGTFVEKFKLSYSYDDVTWYDYEIAGTAKVFVGNRNSNLPKQNPLSKPLTARYVRIHPIREDPKVEPCLRLEFYGCHPSEDCDTPVGMEDWRIADDKITASSQYDSLYASNARLNNEFKMVNGTPRWGGWCTDKSKSSDPHQYLQIDLSRVRGLFGVITQGYISTSWVSQFHVNYSIDGQVWRTIRDPSGRKKTFHGNWDENTTRQNKFDRRVFARYVRFCPLKWNYWICMRVEILECLPTQGSVPTVGPPGSTIDVKRMGSVNLTCLISGQRGVLKSWLQNGQSVAAQRPVPREFSSNLANGSELSVLELRHVRYKDRGAVVSCTAWYPGVSVNSSRTIHLFVHAPRPNVTTSDIKANEVTVKVADPSPHDTEKYLVRYRRVHQFDQVNIERPKKMKVEGDRTVAVLLVEGLHPYTRYQIEVASSFIDQDIGPYSVPQQFMTEEAAPSGPPRDVLVTGVPDVPGAMHVSWFPPDQKLCNGRIIKYQVDYKVDGGSWQTMDTDKMSRVIRGLVENRGYRVKVRAFTKVGAGPWSRLYSYHTEKVSKLTVELENLNKVTVTDNNVGEVAKNVSNIASESSKLVEADISIAANILEKVVKTNETSALVGDHVLDTLSHVMDVKTEVLHNSQEKYNSSGKFVKILENYINKGGKFSKGTPNVAVHTDQLKKSFNKRYVTTVTTEKDKINFNSTDTGAGGSLGGGDASVSIPSSAIPTDRAENVTVIVVYFKTSALFSPEFRKIEVCEDGFTSEKSHKVNKKTDWYTPVTTRGEVVTESSPVLAASLRNMEVANLSSPVIIKFKMPQDQIIENSAKCVWWDFKKSTWSKEGCELKGIVNGTIVCFCNHMTNFAVLVDVHASQSKACGAHAQALTWISKIGCGLSMIGLAITVFTYGFFKKLRKDIAAKILLNLCVALLAVLLVFVGGIERGKLSDLGCLLIAVLIHYFLLVAFMWMLIEAYFMYTAFVKVWRDHGDYVMLKCMLIGWGVPIVAVVVTLAVDVNSYGGKHVCRLDDMAFYYAFVAPVVAVLLINTMVFTIIMYKLSTRPASSCADQDRGRDTLVQLRRAFGILILVGLTWIFGFLAVSRARLAFQYLFSIFNTFQGFCIFMFYCVSQKNVRECWSALLRCDLGSLKKSKSMYTDSYDRRRLSSASKAQMDALRARSNTALAQILQQAPPLRRVDMPVNREQYENRVSYEEDDAERNVTINFQQSTQSDVDSHCSCAEVTVSYSSQSPSPPSRSSSTCGSYGPVMADSPSLRGSRNPSMLGSRSPSACVSRNPSMCGSLHPSMCGSRNPSVCGSRNPSMGGSRENVNSGRSTPKVLRLPRLQRLRSKGVLDWSHKPALKRTASHTPVSHRPPSVHTLLRRTRSSTTSHIREDRLSTCSYTTSSESLNSDGQSPTARQFLDHNHGVPIFNPFGGSIRGIHGHVERNVDNFDILVAELSQQTEAERKRSVSQPASPTNQLR